MTAVVVFVVIVNAVVVALAQEKAAAGAVADPGVTVMSTVPRDPTAVNNSPLRTVRIQTAPSLSKPRELQPICVDRSFPALLHHFEYSNRRHAKKLWMS